MKLNKQLLLAGTIATFATSSIAWADKEPAVEPTPAVEEPAIDETVVDEPAVEESNPDDSVVEITLFEGNEEGEVPEIAICEMVEDGAPIDKCLEPGGPEVQRGEDRDLDPDVIFQTTALDGGSEVPADKASAGFGSDERAADIQGGESKMSSVKPQKKGPVALVKKGRVFLR